jgi:hypothetical protein
VMGFVRAECKFLGERARLGTIPFQKMKILATRSSGYLGEALVRAFFRKKDDNRAARETDAVIMPKLTNT